MKKKPLCKQFAKDVCDILHIDAPKIEFVSSDQMRTDTQIAALIPGAILMKTMLIFRRIFFLPWRTNSGTLTRSQTVQTWKSTRQATK